MEKIITKIDNIAQHVLHKVGVSRKSKTDLEQFRNKFLEQKKATDGLWETPIRKMTKQNSKAETDEKQVEGNLEYCDEVSGA